MRHELTELEKELMALVSIIKKPIEEAILELLNNDITLEHVNSPGLAISLIVIDELYKSFQIILAKHSLKRELQNCDMELKETIIHKTFDKLMKRIL